MTVGLTRLIEDAERIREQFAFEHERNYHNGYVEDEDPTTNRNVQAMDNILEYLRERYVSPSEPGSYKDARGALEVMNDIIRRHNKPAL